MLPNNECILNSLYVPHSILNFVDFRNFSDHSVDQRKKGTTTRSSFLSRQTSEIHLTLHRKFHLWKVEYSLILRRMPQRD